MAKTPAWIREAQSSKEVREYKEYPFISKHLKPSKITKITQQDIPDTHKIRWDLKNVENVKKALGVYIPRFEELRSLLADMDGYFDRDLEVAPELKRQRAEADVLIHKIKWSIQTAELWVVKYQSILYEVQDVFTFTPYFTVDRDTVSEHFKNTRENKLFDYAEFVLDYVSKPEHFGHATSTIEKAWREYRIKTQYIGMQMVGEKALIRWEKRRGQSIIDAWYDFLGALQELEQALSEALTMMKATSFEPLEESLERIKEIVGLDAPLSVAAQIKGLMPVGPTKRKKTGPLIPDVKRAPTILQPPIERPKKKLEKMPTPEEFLKDPVPVEQLPRMTNPQKISFAGRTHLVIMLTYTKITPPEDGVTKIYTVEPYSYRYKQTKAGRKKYFFGFDTIDGHIKKFLVSNIRDVRIMSWGFEPRWEIEV